jgi:formylglycine-generating enzyme required for sulfatase activity
MRDENEDRGSWDGLSTESADEAAPPARASPSSFPPQEFANFLIVGSLGQGGMGHVYKAYDTSIGRYVAIKFIRQPGEAQRARFLTEARAAGKLNHPNIVQIFHFDDLAGQPYIVAEYVEGTSLSTHRKPISWREALPLGIDLATGLAAAHREGVLHRDIKPSNVIVTRSGVAKLLDFGLAKLQDGAPEIDGTNGGAGSPAEPHTSPTETGSVLGTPYYMAPEAWRGETSGAADVYAMGVVLYELCTGRVPFGEVSREELPWHVQQQDAPRLAQLVPDVAPGFAAVVERCLARDPGQRFASGRELCDALTALVPRQRIRTPHQSPAQAADRAHPYPGLRPFDEEDVGYFFGREHDVRGVVERLRTAPMVLVAGTSGVGKSSLVRAGVLPSLAAQGLDDTGGWQVRSWVPGSRPLQAMSMALRADLGMDEEALTAALERDPLEIGHRLQRTVGTGMVLFVDQFEELVTVSGAEEAAQASRALATLAARFPRIRVLATVRGDKLTEVAGLLGLHALVQPALYVLQPLGEAQVREAVVRPAECCGVRFESEALVTRLVRDTIREAGGLPFLQFALSLLWERRDQQQAVIPDAALADIGGVAGALSQHADRVLDELLPETRMAARTILLRLVTLRGSRVRHTKDELLAGGAAHEAALAALVTGRLLVARETEGQPAYEIAHEALIDGWPRLRAWLTEEDRLLRVKQQLARDAEEWERQARSREALWQSRRLREARDVDVQDLVPREADFLRESRRTARRARRLRQLAVVTAMCAGLGLYGWSYEMHRRELRGYLDEAGRILATARTLEDQYRLDRDQALTSYAGFDATRPDADEKILEAGERSWRRAVSAAPVIDRMLVEATRPLELALLRDPSHPEVHRLQGETLYARALLAEDQGHTGELSVQVERLAAYDPVRAARWLQRVPVTVETSVAGVEMELYEYRLDAGGTFSKTSRGRTQATPARWELPPGSYLLVVPPQGDRAEIRYPFWVAPGRHQEPDPMTLHIDVPLASEVPRDMVYVPAGWSWFGFGGDEITEPMRTWQLASPPHQRWIEAFYIEQHETTYAQWMEFLRALPPDERGKHLPEAEFDGMFVELQDIDGKFMFHYRAEIEQEPQLAGEGELIEYGRRDQQRKQDWRQFPVTGINGEDVNAYARWLSEQGIVPGARMCREDEWERAARGADLRIYPHGNQLSPSDANIDITYGRKNGAYGFDAVGLHPQSRSPFGLDDMMGNARELVVSILEVNKLTQRSGGFFHEPRTNPIVNRELVLMNQRNPYLGFRICAERSPDRRSAR